VVLLPAPFEPPGEQLLDQVTEVAPDLISLFVLPKSAHDISVGIAPNEGSDALIIFAGPLARRPPHPAFDRGSRWGVQPFSERYIFFLRPAYFWAYRWARLRV
jgi:hypothetical protein